MSVPKRMFRGVNPLKTLTLIMIMITFHFSCCFCSPRRKLLAFTMHRWTGETKMLAVDNNLEAIHNTQMDSSSYDVSYKRLKVDNMENSFTNRNMMVNNIDYGPSGPNHSHDPKKHNTIHV
ncbi:hypothetical protein KP509_34G047400 [Ceratopteris richardii]|uniref:Uncharacterized protein n=1 Tax=Ceratopteris richardii TaxID=49495 RepID=A0A8T2QLA6_CERRI|nr:hypothetical protein KP509_34G047400 [Ceratopteris richardii]